MMPRMILATLVLSLAMGAVQATEPTKHRHVRTTDRSLRYEEWRNSNAYAVTTDTSSRSEGAMTSGLAGH
jgi:hypothetical protein